MSIAAVPGLDRLLWGGADAVRHIYVRSARTDRADPFSPPPVPISFAVLEARKSLATLALPARTMDAVDVFLKQVCSPRSTVPSIAIGDDPDSALLHWVVGPMSVEVEVGPNGATYFWGVDESGATESVEDSPQRIRSLTLRLVEAMAQRALRANPDWRQQYQQRR